ncbi:MAG: M20/M25/M40 family metallo-hydrolase [Phycisphaerales bacterium]|nr:M20/M25/M40 family metallo-hydrolase [Phycisphaerales bacterium]
MLNTDQKTHVGGLLAELVRIPSVNENAEQANRDRAESAVADFLEQWLTSRLGMTVSRVPLSPGRDNLVAHWPDQAAARSFALQAHMDTVSVRGMTVEPFAAEVREGRMWGRGTCDTKGSMAAFLSALRAARERDWRFVDKVYFVATVAEETGCKGSSALTAAGFGVDAMIVGEPTMCTAVTAHKGTSWSRLTTAGRSCHASMPQHGHNAIYAMAKAVRFIEDRFIPGLSARQHPLLGSPTLSVGVIQGGVATNIVPDRCTANLDFRLLPGQDPGPWIEGFMSALRAAVPDESFTIENIHNQPGVETPIDTPWVRNVLAGCARTSGRSQPAGVTYYTDAGPFHAAGIQCVVFGPGDIAQAHTEAEFLDLEQLYMATETAIEWLEAARTRSLVAD